MNKLLSILFSHNWIAIFYFNFKMLPFREAIKLPFDFSRKIRFKNISGRVRITSPNIHRGMVKIGFHGSDMFPNMTTVMDLRGVLIVEARVSIGTGSLIRIEDEGNVNIERNVVIGAKSMLFCEDSIWIKKNTITSWDCQIMDTDTHSIRDTVTNKVSNRSGPILIGERCWIGNNVSINKSVVLPADTIVASYSLCNKDYSKIVSPFSLIGGIPAQLLAENKRRANDKL